MRDCRALGRQGLRQLALVICCLRLVAGLATALAAVPACAQTVAAAPATTPAATPAAAITRTTADVADASVGMRVYREGLLPAGQPLRGQRDGGASIEGRAAACATCHRRSGLGGSEGLTVVPPIIGKYLFRPHSTNVQDLSLPHVLGYRSTREPYTRDTLARAIREGVDASGRPLSYLMPRYALDDSTVASLADYLERLTATTPPGVTEDVLHFATVITPEADADERKAMLDVMQAFFADKNAFIRGGGKPMQARREIEYRVTRRWQLHAWELTGAPETWEAQLRAKAAAEPVFAIISGLGGAHWLPVHRFCEQARVPCLFPNVDRPEVAEQDFYPVYFSRGVLLEADLMAERLADPTAKGPRIKRVRQLVREGSTGEAAARQLQSARALEAIRFETRMLPAQGPIGAALPSALAGLGADDALVMWLSKADLAALPGSPPPVADVLASGLLGGLEAMPLPDAWRPRVHLSYPFDLPDARRVRVNFPLAWFRIHHIPVVAERVQVDTYIALGILAETLNDMLDSFVPDYLVERVEVMLGHRLVTGYYPRLSLAAGQRFASKGGQIVHFAEATGPALAADTDWLAP